MEDEHEDILTLERRALQWKRSERERAGGKRSHHQKVEERVLGAGEWENRKTSPRLVPGGREPGLSSGRQQVRR